jgi:lipopolysaccharide export system permease protein
MKTLDRYILAKTLWPLFACIAIALVAMLLERMVRLLDLVVNRGGPFSLILKMLANLIPHYLGLAIPAAFFVGILLAVMRLSSDSELDAVHSMGVGLHRLLATLMGLAVVLMVITGIILSVLQPYTRYAYRALVYTVTHTAWNAALERGTFFTGLGDLTVMVDDITDGGRKLSGIFLHQTEPDGTTQTITAKEGRLYRTKQTDFRLILRLSMGASVESDAGGARPTVVTFDQLDLPLDLATGPIRLNERGERTSELTIFELWDLLGTTPPPGLPADKIEAEFHSRLVRIVSLLSLPLVAIPLGIVSRRARRGVGMVAGLILLILFHYILRFGESMVETGVLSPLLGLWLPCGVFAAIGVWAFQTTSKRPGYSPVAATLDRASEAVEGLRRLFARRGLPA